jgi:tetratricopeptide (TPR) repeat protein
LQQAIRLNPNLADAHRGYSHFLCIMGRMEEALLHIERAIEQDPLNPFINYFYGMVLGFIGRPDDVIAAFHTVLEIEPNFVLALGGVATMLYLKGKPDEALAIFRKIYAGDAEITAGLEDGFEKNGFNGAYRAVADLMAERYGKPGSENAGGIAIWYLRAGEYDLAIDWLEKSYEEHEPSMPYIGLFGGDLLSSYPRFQDLLRKMNLPVEEWE